MKRDVKGTGDSQQASETGIAATSFDIGDVGSRKLAALGERLLGPGFAFASAQDLGSQAPSHFFFGFMFHGRVTNQVK